VQNKKKPTTELKEFKKNLEFFIIRSLKRNSTKGSGKRVFSLIISEKLKNYLVSSFNFNHKLTYAPNFINEFQITDFKRFTDVCDGFYFIMNESFRVKIRKSSIKYLDNIQSQRKHNHIFFFCVEFTCKFEKQNTD